MTRKMNTLFGAAALVAGTAFLTSTVVGVLVSVAAGTMAGPPDVVEAASVSKVVTVDTVIDGDTFEYRENGAIRRVRVAGLNTNELAQSPKCWVDEATERARVVVRVLPDGVARHSPARCPRPGRRNTTGQFPSGTGRAVRR